MTSYHPLLRFGEIDAALLGSNDKAGRSVTVCVYKSTVLQNKDRVACQVFDGGTAYDQPGDMVAFGVRLVMRAQAMDLAQIKDGLIIRLAPDTVIHTLKSGEKVFDCYDCEVLDLWQAMRQNVTNVVNNPLSKPGAPSLPVYQPPTSTGPPVQARSAATSIAMEPTPQLHREPPAPSPVATMKEKSTTSNTSADSYGPERTTRQQQPKSVEPYAAVKQKSKENSKYLKISDLTSYVDKWRILARVTSRSEIREYRNARGDGKLFSVDLIDAEGVEIKGTFFNDAVDRFSPMIKKNGVYSFARGQIKSANPRFKKFDHLYELTFGLDAEIVEEESNSASASTEAIPLAKLNAKSLAEADASEVDTLLDIVCLCYQVYDTTQITIKATGSRKDKRTVQVIDQSGVIIPLTLWGSDCSLLPSGSWSHKQGYQQQDHSGGTAEYYLVVKKAKVDEFNGKKLSSSMGLVQVYIWNNDQWFGSVEDSENMQPSMIPPEIIDLKDWVTESKASASGLQGIRSSSTNSNAAMAKVYHCIADMLNECQTMSSEQLSSGAYFSMVATIVESNITPHRKFFWAACASCGKKLQGGPDGATDSFGAGNMNAPYTCAQCDLTVEVPDRKYNFTLDIQDYSNTVKVSVLGDQGRDLFGGMSANDLENLKMHRGTNGEEFQDVIQGLRRQEYLFKIVARNETWQDETRIKYRVMAVQQLSGDSLVGYLQKQKDAIDSILSM